MWLTLRTFNNSTCPIESISFRFQRLFCFLQVAAFAPFNFAHSRRFSLSDPLLFAPTDRQKLLFQLAAVDYRR